MFDNLPGAVLADQLACCDPSTSRDEDLLAAIVAYERMVSWATARQSAAIAELHRRCDEEAAQQRRATVAGDSRLPNPLDGGERASAEIAVALRISRRAADARVGLAFQLHDRVPGTAVALEKGRIGVGSARAIAEGTDHLDPDHVRRVEQHVLVRAGHQTPSRLRECVARAADHLDPATAERRRVRARREREVTFQPLPDGLGEVRLVTTAVVARACYDTIAAAGRARRGTEDDRGADERRADAAVALLLSAVRGDGIRASSPEAGQGPPSEQAQAVSSPAATHDRAEEATSADLPSHVPIRVQITVSLDTLLGIAQEPAELSGYGPITAVSAREVAHSAGGVWQRLVTDPVTGELSDVGRTTYRPPAGLDRFVRARDGRCRFPGCGTPARLTDLDHTVPFPDGPTSASNLAALCRHHHRLKHEGSWLVSQQEGAALVWRSPFGQVVDTAPSGPLPRV
jgi:hypothetical protein